MNKTKKYVSLTLLVLWMGVIYYFSSQDGEASGALSNGLLFNIAKMLNINDIAAFLKEYGTFIRKLAHFTEYFILGVLMYYAFRQYSNKVYVVCIIMCALYATTDEVHQLFVADRAFGVLDILLDSFGSFVGISLLHLILNKCYQEKKH